MFRCQNHTGEQATHQCSLCSRAYCPACVAQKRYGTTVMDVCPACGSALRRFPPELLERPASRSLIGELPLIIRFPVTLDGALTLLGLSITVWLAGTAGSLLPGIAPLTDLAAWCIAAIFLVTLVRHAARGRTGMPQWDELGGPVGLLPPVGRAVAATLPGWLPLAWHLGNNRLLADPLLLFDLEFLRDRLLTPVGIGFAALAFAYLPMALVLATIRNRLPAAMNPVAAIRLVARAPRRYLELLMVLAVMLLLQAGVWLAVSLTGELAPAPVVGPVVLGALAFYLPALAAFSLGRMIYLNAEQFGCLDLVAGSGPVRPGGEVPPDATEHLVRAKEFRQRGQLLAALEHYDRYLLLNPGDRNVLLETFEIYRSLKDQRKLEETGLRLIGLMFEERQDRAAAGIYLQLERYNPKVHLAPVLQWRMGEALGQQARWLEAFNAFRKIGVLTPEAPEAPAALLRCGLLALERMQDEEKARAVFRYLQQKFPGSGAARDAEQMLPVQTVRPRAITIAEEPARSSPPPSRPPDDDDLPEIF